MEHCKLQFVTPKVWISAFESATAKSLPPSVAPTDSSSSNNNNSALFEHDMISIVHSITDYPTDDDYNATG